MGSVLHAAPGAVRRVGGGAKNDLRALRRTVSARRAAATAAAAAGASAATQPPVHVIGDVASFPLVASLLDIAPEARLAVEPDRRLLGLTPVDAP